MEKKECKKGILLIIIFMFTALLSTIITACNDTCKHEIILDDAIAATCLHAGKTEGQHCGKCGKVIVKQTETAILEHDYSNENNFCSMCNLKYTEDKKTVVYCNPEAIEISIPNYVTMIGENAFVQGTLYKITLPDSLKLICENAFAYVRVIEICNHSSLEINAGETDNGRIAFYTKNIYSEGNGKLSINEGGYVVYEEDNEVSLLSYLGNEQRIVIPEGVTKIDGNAFISKNALSITVPSSVHKIEENAFYNCNILEIINCSSLELSAGTTDNGGIAQSAIIVHDNDSSKLLIDDESFVTFNDENNGIVLVSYIGDRIDVEIPEGINYISQNAFCDGTVYRVTLPSSLTKIDDNWLKNSSIIEICNKSPLDIKAGSDIAKNVKNVYVNGTGNLAISNDFVVYFDKDNKTLLSYLGKEEDIVVPEGITEIGSRAFYNNNYIKSVMFPNDVAILGAYAFSDCYKLESINMSSSITKIGEGCFASCKNLKSIDIPQNVTRIEHDTFRSCSNLQSVNVATEGITFIGMNAFMECSNLTRFVVPTTVKSILEQAFIGCSRLVEICNLSSRNIEITGSGNDYSMIAANAKYVYNNLWQMSRLSEDENGLVIYNDNNEKTIIAYHGENPHVNIPEYISHINSAAFKENPIIESVDISNGMLTIGHFAFRECVNLQSINIPQSVSSIGLYAFDGCKNLKKIVIPNNVTTLGSSIFSGCENLTEVTLPDTIVSIDSYAFYKCYNIKSISLPASLQKIGECAFYNNYSLRTILFRGNTLYWIDDIKRETDWNTNTCEESFEIVCMDGSLKRL